MVDCFHDHVHIDDNSQSGPSSGRCRYLTASGQKPIAPDPLISPVFRADRRERDLHRRPIEASVFIETVLGPPYSGNAGAELPELMTAGRWDSPTMPAKYTEGQADGSGAVARYYRGDLRK